MDKKYYQRMDKKTAAETIEAQIEFEQKLEMSVEAQITANTERNELANQLKKRNIVLISGNTYPNESNDKTKVESMFGPSVNDLENSRNSRPDIFEPVASPWRNKSKRAKYICIEGVEGVGKTTQVELLVKKLESMGYKVLQTKEPGTPHIPLTMTLRNIMLDSQYNEQLMTPIAREYVSQAIRAIHLDKLIVPSLDKYDFIIQDRGLLSGFAYGVACGNREEWITDWLFKMTTNMNHQPDSKLPPRIYDSVILIVPSDVEKCLLGAKKAKQEFKMGDAMELKGLEFMKTVQENMQKYKDYFAWSRIEYDTELGEKDAVASIFLIHKEILRCALVDIRE